MLARPFHGLPNSGDYLLRPGFNLCVHLCHGKYSNVHEKLLFCNLHVVLCYTSRTQKPAKELLEQFEQLRKILRNFNQILHQIQTWGTLKTRSTVMQRLQVKQGSQPLPEKSVMPTRPAGTSAMTTRKTAQITATFTAILNQNNAANMPTSLKVTSGAAGIKAMAPFDLTKDKAIYQRWQLWSEKARHALGCMEGDSVKAKIIFLPLDRLTRNGSH